MSLDTFLAQSSTEEKPAIWKIKKKLKETLHQSIEAMTDERVETLAAFDRETLDIFFQRYLTVGQLVSDVVKKAHKTSMPKLIECITAGRYKKVVEIQNTYDAVCTFMIDECILLVTTSRKRTLDTEFIEDMQKILVKNKADLPYVGLVVISKHEIQTTIKNAMIVDTPVDKLKSTKNGPLSVLMYENFNMKRYESINMILKAMQSVLVYKYHTSDAALPSVDRILKLIEALELNDVIESE